MLTDLAPHTSTYQGLKLLIGQVVPLERNTIHILIGLLIVAIALALSRAGTIQRPLIWALGASLLAGVAMEALDRRDDIAWLGYWRWSVSLADVLRTVSVPVLLIAVFYVAERVKR